MRKITSVHLDPNKGYDHRIAIFTLLKPDSPIIGLLQVIESNSKNSKRNVKKYAIREEIIQEPGRAFRCTKPGDGKEFYTVKIGPDQTELDTCECKAFESGKTFHCVHIQSLRRVFMKGGI